MLSIACPLRYPLKAIQFILDSSLMPFTSLLSYMMQLLHSLVLTHHLLHPSLALLCFRRLPSEPQVRACNPKLLQATVLPSRHGLARYGLSPALTIARICFTDRIFFSLHSPPSGVWLVPPFWTAPSLLPSPCHGGRRSSLARVSARLESPHSLHMLLFVCRDASPPLAWEGGPSAQLPRFDDLFCVITAKRSWLCLWVYCHCFHKHVFSNQLDQGCDPRGLSSAPSNSGPCH